jgi:hypothetical protein
VLFRGKLDDVRQWFQSKLGGNRGLHLVSVDGLDRIFRGQFGPVERSQSRSGLLGPIGLHAVEDGVIHREIANGPIQGDS